MDNKYVVRAIYWADWLADAERYEMKTHGDYFSILDAQRLEHMAKSIREKIQNKDKKGINL